MAGHIDFHFHALPPAYKVAVKAHGGDPSGFPEPDWSPEAAITSMEAVGASLGDYTRPIDHIKRCHGHSHVIRYPVRLLARRPNHRSRRGGPQARP